MDTSSLQPTADEQPLPPVAKADDSKPKTPMEHWLRRQLPNQNLRAVVETLKKLEAGVPVPYLAYFGGEETGGLKSDDLYRLLDLKLEWEEIARKQAHMLQEVKAQGRLTDELKLQIERSSDLDRLEDLYAPYKLKRQTLGVQAREAGLAPLADYFWSRAHNEEVAELAGASPEEKAVPFAKADSKFPDAAAVLKGVQDILVERIAEAFELRTLVRATVLRRSKIRATKGPKAKANSKYTKYFDYQEPIGSLKKASSAHRYLAMRRGWMEDELVLSFDRPDEGVLLEKFEEFACPNKESPGAETLIQAARLALKGSLYTVMENEAHRHMKEEAERHVIESLAETLRKKLLRPGLGRKAVMGIDPGNASHPASLALVDLDGKLLLNLSFKLEEADANKQEFLTSLENLGIEAVAVAHGPRAKEVRDAFQNIFDEAGKKLPIVNVHEHSSSIYPSSPAAKEEFPQLDVTARRAVFVARYLQNPLSVILRLDPKFLSLGEFQHEVSQSRLRHALERSIEASVNFVGVDPNFAPVHVLAQVAGLNQELARAIAQFREGHKLASREDLKKVPSLGARFDHCAGFLRVQDSTEKLDTTFVHPAFYEAVRAFAASQGAADPFSLSEEQRALAETDPALVAAVGARNAKHVAFELGHAGEDPRGDFSVFAYDPALKTFADLKKDQAYPGIVTNVTSFGAFVDVGIDQDGLVHISELVDAAAKNPFDTLYPGDPVTVWVSHVNEEKKQISLTMKPAGARPPRGERRPRRADGGGERPRRPRHPRGPRQAAAPGGTGEAAAPAEGGGKSPEGRPEGGRDRPRGRFRGREGGEGAKGRREAREDRPPRKPKKPTRDPKTGAIVKLDDDDSRSRGGPKLPAKAKPMNFNPFANLANILKEKQDKS